MTGDRLQVIQDNLHKSVLPKLENSEITPLEEQITSTQFKLAISYRPISLLNLDLKLLVKITAKRLRPLLSDLIARNKMTLCLGERREIM